MMAVILLIAFLFGVSNDSNAQERIQIGEQIWMKSNLAITTFRNGDSILQAQSSEEWMQAGRNGIPAWCYYDNEEGNGSIHGLLYNQHAVLDPRGLAPSGWHIPDMKEWKTLCAQYGGDSEAGYSLISANHWLITEWTPKNTKPSSGFDAYGSGARDIEGKFHDIEKKVGYYALNQQSDVSTIHESHDMEIDIEVHIPKVKVVMMNNLTPMVGIYDIQHTEGYSIRCIKD